MSVHVHYHIHRPFRLPTRDAPRESVVTEALHQLQVIVDLVSESSSPPISADHHADMANRYTKVLKDAGQELPVKVTARARFFRGAGWRV